MRIDEWHEIYAVRDSSGGQLKLDNELGMATGQSLGPNNRLSAGNLTYIGGVGQGVVIPSRAGITGGGFICLPVI